LGFSEGAQGELQNYFSNGIISSVPVPNEPIIQSMFIVRVQEILENGGITENRFLENLDSFREN
jgi:hypothetical protein